MKSRLDREKESPYNSYRDIPLIKGCSMTDQESTQFGEPKVFNVFYGFEMSLKFGK